MHVHVYTFSALMNGIYKGCHVYLLHLSQVDLGVNSGCVAEYKGEPLRTVGGVVTVRTLTSAGIR